MAGVNEYERARARPTFIVGAFMIILQLVVVLQQIR